MVIDNESFDRDMNKGNYKVIYILLELVRHYVTRQLHAEAIKYLH